MAEVEGDGLVLSTGKTSWRSGKLSPIVTTKFRSIEYNFMEIRGGGSRNPHTSSDAHKSMRILLSWGQSGGLGMFFGGP